MIGELVRLCPQTLSYPHTFKSACRASGTDGSHAAISGRWYVIYQCRVCWTANLVGRGVFTLAIRKLTKLEMRNGLTWGSRRLPPCGAMLRLLRLPFAGQTVSRIPAFPPDSVDAMLKAPILSIFSRRSQASAVAGGRGRVGEAAARHLAPAACSLENPKTSRQALLRTLSPERNRWFS